jgi:5-methylcytosine-specific restriction endonuclease McrA
MKKNRLLVLERTKGVCEICGSKGEHLHHKDRTKANHDLKNLIFLCTKCHGKKHTGKRNTKKDIQ